MFNDKTEPSGGNTKEWARTRIGGPELLTLTTRFYVWWQTEIERSDSNYVTIAPSKTTSGHANSLYSRTSWVALTISPIMVASNYYNRILRTCFFISETIYELAATLRVSFLIDSNHFCHWLIPFRNLWSSDFVIKHPHTHNERLLDPMVSW